MVTLSNQWTTWHTNELEKTLQNYCEKYNENKNMIAEKALAHFAFNWKDYWDDYSRGIDQNRIDSDERLDGVGLVMLKSKNEKNAIGANVADEIDGKLQEAKEFLSDKLNRQISKACMMRTALMHYLRLSGIEID